PGDPAAVSSLHISPPELPAARRVRRAPVLEQGVLISVNAAFSGGRASPFLLSRKPIHLLGDFSRGHAKRSSDIGTRSVGNVLRIAAARFAFTRVSWKEPATSLDSASPCRQRPENPAPPLTAQASARTRAAVVLSRNRRLSLVDAEVLTSVRKPSRIIDPIGSWTLCEYWSNPAQLPHPAAARSASSRKVPL
ncbi:MAG: hypothetical protein QOH56_765, partial [Pseudonocardiales bacterium]|nr:hypothetical protein [Pseudonocardiales bacterium]